MAFCVHIAWHDPLKLTSLCFDKAAHTHTHTSRAVQTAKIPLLFAYMHANMQSWNIWKQQRNITIISWAYMLRNI